MKLIGLLVGPVVDKKVFNWLVCHFFKMIDEELPKEAKARGYQLDFLRASLARVLSDEKRMKELFRQLLAKLGE